MRQITIKLVLNSYAKLNLYLEVLGKRKDSYHNIRTLFERIDLSDKIILEPRRDKKIKIICSFKDVPRDNTNLCYRSAKLLQDSLGCDRGVNIKIAKRIPVGAGLGGGSSNAAVTLLGLNKLWKLNLTQDKLLGFAKKIGSDVPFFVYNSPFAQGKSRGDIIEPQEALNKVKLWHILIVPRIKVSTPVIYRKWDALVERLQIKRAGLTKPNYGVKILNLAIKKGDLALIAEALFNNLESATVRVYPQLRQIKDKLIQMGVKTILMSGSGPAVFGIVSSRKEAVSLKRQLKGRGKFWQVFVTRTI